MDTRPVFITGGSGFVGRNLIRGFRARGFRVIALARSERSMDTVAALGAEPKRGDVLDKATLIAACQGSGLVVHAAAETSHGDGTPEQERINVEGTRTVMVAARAAGVPRAIHISTEAVLADGRPLHAVDESHPIPVKHAGSYSRTKAAAERVALAENRDGLEVIVVRPRFVWGRDDTTALPQLVDAASTGKLKWIGGGRYLTSTTHVANLVDGVFAAAERGRGGEVYFVTDGEPVEFRDFVTKLLAARGVVAPTASVPRFVVRAAIEIGSLLSKLTGDRVRPPMSRQEYATLAHEMTVRDDKARRELGYRPQITVETGLQELRMPPWLPG